MALVVFLQEDKDVLSVYCNLKIFWETAPRALQVLFPEFNDGPGSMVRFLQLVSYG